MQCFDDEQKHLAVGRLASLPHQELPRLPHVIAMGRYCNASLWNLRNDLGEEGRTSSVLLLLVSIRVGAIISSAASCIVSHSGKVDGGKVCFQSFTGAARVACIQYLPMRSRQLSMAATKVEALGAGRRRAQPMQWQGKRRRDATLDGRHASFPFWG